MKTILKVFLGIIAVIVLIGLIILGIRTYNTNKYRPKDYNPEEDIPASELSQYDTNLEGIEITRIVGGYINGFRLVPQEKIHPGVVITFGGSEGSPNYEMAKWLSSQGYEVLSLFFFGMDNQEKELVKVPLEFFDEVLEYINDNIQDGEIITVYGGSKGAELGLNLATRYGEIDNLILMAPAEYSYMGLSYEDFSQMNSSWTWEGREVPYIDMQAGGVRSGFDLFKGFLLNEPIAYRPGYESAAEGDPNREEARIKVENTDANILLFAGDDDNMWQSEIAAENIYNRRPENTDLHIYKGAGHIFYLPDRLIYSQGMTLDMGGNKESNETAMRESNQIILEKLNEWHR